MVQVLKARASLVVTTVVAKPVTVTQTKVPAVVPPTSVFLMEHASRLPVAVVALAVGQVVRAVSVEG